MTISSNIFEVKIFVKLLLKIYLNFDHEIQLRCKITKLLKNTIEFKSSKKEKIPIFITSYIMTFITLDNFVSVQSAKLNTAGLFKPDPYLELSVDSMIPKKTEVCKKSTTPRWEEHFTV